MHLSLKSLFVLWFAAVGICVFGGCGDAYQGPETADQAGQNALRGADSNRESRVYLYFVEPGGRYLTGEIRNIEHPGDTLVYCRMMLEALIKGPGRGAAAGSLIPVLDPETRVMGVYTDDAGTLYADLSGNAFFSHPKGVRSELLTVYAIVNTLVVNADDIDRVRILLDGSEAETFAGHIDIRYPANANMLLVR